MCGSPNPTPILQAEGRRSLQGSGVSKERIPKEGTAGKSISEWSAGGTLAFHAAGAAFKKESGSQKAWENKRHRGREASARCCALGWAWDGLCFPRGARRGWIGVRNGRFLLRPPSERAARGRQPGRTSNRVAKGAG